MCSTAPMRAPDPARGPAAALLEATGRGVRLWTEGGQLRFRGPEGALDGPLRAALAAHREVLLGLLPGPHEPEVAWHPLSGTQRGLWFLHRLDPACSAYHLPFAAQIDGPFDPEQLLARLGGAVARHAILRTTFPSFGGVPVQRVRGEGAADAAVVDATGWTDEALDRDLQSLADAPFDLAAGPLLRARIYRRGPEAHVVALVVHHAVADLASLSLLIEELVVGAAEPPGAPFHAFARSQADRAQGPDSDAAVEAWCSDLDGADWSPVLPSDRRASADSDRAGRFHRVLLPEALAARLERRAAEGGATCYALLLAAFGLLLQQRTGQADLLLGSPVSGRFDLAHARSLGPFADVVPLRLRSADGQPFSARLEAAQAASGAAIARSSVPFATLIRRLGPPREAGRAETLRAVLSWQSLAPGAPPAHRELVAGSLGRPVRLGAATWTARTIDPSAVAFDLALTACRLDAGIACTFEVRRALFSEDAVAGLAAGWATLLEEIADGSEEPRSLPPSERARLIGPLSRGGAVAQEAAPPASVAERVVRQARARSAEVVCVGPEGALRWGELLARAADVARRLPPSPRVALLAGPGPEQLVGLLGILLAGRAFVPLGEGDPTARQRSMLDDAGVAAVVASPGFSARAVPLGRAVIGTEPAAAPQPPHVAPPPIAGPPPGDGEREVYVAFTSGSTGRPKGVIVRERNLGPVLDWGLRDLRLGPDTRVLQNLSIVFDFGIFEVLTTLVAGGTLVVPGPDRSLAQLLDFAAAEGVDTLHTTPSWARLVLSAGRRLPTLRTVHFGGEELPLDLVERVLAAAHPEGRVVNGYGPTEATINCTVAAFDRASLATLRRLPSVPIGRPAPPARIYVLDAAGEPAPIGGRGELCIGGPTVAEALLAADAGAFVPDPFEPGGRLYRSGDVARMMPSGDLLFCGRKDRQVQLRGRRVELGEVEAALLRHPGVAEVAAELRAGPRGPRLLAWVVAAGPALPEEELRRHAEAELPAPLVPSRIVALPALPRSRAGKVDRAALEEPIPPARPAPLAGAEAGGDPLEAAVLDAFRALLDDPTVGPLDDFFERGDSLLAVELAHRVGQAVGRDLSGGAVFRAPTARALARWLRDPAGRRLQTVHPGGGRPPLFVLPPGELELPALARLARLLPPDRPVHLVQPARADTLEGLLERYADAVEAAQPLGPLRLLGYCVGGQIAWALAGALEARGRAVALVILVDSPFRESRLGTAAWKGAGRVVRRVGARGRGRIARHARGLFLDPGVDAHARVLEGWSPGPRGGRVAYLMARRSHFRLMPTRRRWAGVASEGLEFAWVSGDHDSLLHDPHAAALAAEIEARLG